MAIPVDKALEAHIDSAAALSGLEISPEFRPGVVLNFKRTAEIASLVNDFVLPDAVECAPIFQP